MRMKRHVKICSLVLVLILMGALFAGCSGNDTDTSPTVSSDPGQTSQPQVSAAPSDEYVYKMPIADSPYTVTGWRVFTSTYITSPNEILANQELEKRTNIHIDYKLVPQTDQTTQFNLMITSGDYTDLIFLGVAGGTPEYTGGLDKAISDGVFLELSDVVNKWMPNFKALMNSNDSIRKQEHTDEGNIGAIITIQNGNQPAWIGPGIRLDLLNKVGITEVPKTYDELYAALKKFKNELNIEQPLVINYTGYNTLSKGMTSGFDVDGDFYNQDGTVKFGFLEPGFREYLEMMHKWYTEGLIDQEFFTRTAASDLTAMDRIPAGKVGATEQMIYTMPSVYKALSGDPDFKIVAMPIPRKSADYVAHFRRFNEITGTTAIAVTTVVDDVDKLEKIARWIDYRFSEEGSLLLNYGIEGDTFEYVDGKPFFTEKITNNPDGTSSSDMMQLMTENPAYGMLYDWTREKAIVSDEDWAAYDIWGNSASGDWNMPPITMTSEEGNEFADIFGDIKTLIEETIPMFITGQKPLSEYDSFVEQLKALNIDRCIELKQAALDRYLAR